MAPAIYEGSLRYNALAHSVEDKLGNIVQIQLLHDLRAVCLDSIHAQTQEVGHVLARLALSDQLKDLTLTGGQQFIRIIRPGSFQLSRIVLEQHLPHGRAKERLPARN